MVLHLVVHLPDPETCLEDDHAATTTHCSEQLVRGPFGAFALPSNAPPSAEFGQDKSSAEQWHVTIWPRSATAGGLEYLRVRPRNK